MHRPSASAAMLIPLVLLLLPRSVLAGDSATHPVASPGQPSSWPASPTTALRPNLYFGTRDKAPDETAMQTSLLWFAQEDKLRMECRHEDELERWGWDRCDGRGYGEQTLRDGGLRLGMEFLAGYGSEFGLRVNGSFASGIAATPVSLLLALACPSGADLPRASGQGLPGDVASVRCGDYVLEARWGEPEPARNSHEICTEHTTRVRGPQLWPPELSRTHFAGFRVAAREAWDLKPLVRAQLARSGEAAREVVRRLHEHGARAAVPLLGNRFARGDTLVVLQRVVFAQAFSVRVFLRRAPASGPTGASGADLEQALAVGLAERRARFERELADKFGLRGLGRAETNMAAYALGNLLGSQGYFSGANLVAGLGEYRPGSLFTGVPSRSFFPRGFLWDEGFHQLVVGVWDANLSQEILGSWLERVDEEGWVAREQILGSEALSRVPPEFRVQNRSFANPPTLLLAVSRLAAAGQAGEAFLDRAFQLLLRNYRWLVRTQVAALDKRGFAWVGRSADGRHTLPSGLDDYPRGRGGFHNFELHVDLLAWVAWSEGALAAMAERLGRPDEAGELREAQAGHLQVLDDVHWNAGLGFYCDVGVLDGDYPLPVRGSASAKPSVSWVPHIGYAGALPFCLELVPGTDTDKLAAWLRVMESESELRARGVGLRSLSKADALFGQGEDYWRGAVWLNINYLCISALQHYAARAADAGVRARAGALAGELRRDVLGNVLEQFRKTGFLFESYDAQTGLGKGTRPFTGWTSLVVLLMGGDDRGAAAARHSERHAAGL